MSWRKRNPSSGLPAAISHVDGADDAAPARYRRFHATRYAVLLDTVTARVASLPDPAREHPRILDIGPGYQTPLLRERFSRGITNTVGFPHKVAAPTGRERHFSLDLNECGERRRWPSLPRHHIVTMAEVIEHLTVSPVAVLQWIEELLEPGGWLILQTPNSLALHRRLRMLGGRSPTGPVPGTAGAPGTRGHFREHSISDLVAIGEAAGFAYHAHEVRNHFRRDSFVASAYDRVTSLLPPSFRQGITISYMKRPGPLETDDRFE